MEGKELRKEYVNGDLTVIWKPAKCIHAKVCVSTLPNVYDPNKKPWIEAENASISELKDQIDKCPSGALSYRMKNDSSQTSQDSIQVTVAANGPLLVNGSIEITDSSGKVEVKSKAAFCRCGASSNKPYCDGSHNKIDFKG